MIISYSLSHSDIHLILISCFQEQALISPKSSTAAAPWRGMFNINAIITQAYAAVVILALRGPVG